MKPLAKHITESFQNVNESIKIPTQIKVLKTIYLPREAANSTLWSSHKPNGDFDKSNIGEILTFSHEYYPKDGSPVGLNYVDAKGKPDAEFLHSDIENLLKEKAISVTYDANESSEEIDPIVMAIEYLIGEPIARYHDEANNYAYQLARKGTSGWLTILRKDVDDTVKHHFSESTLKRKRTFYQKHALNESKLTLSGDNADVKKFYDFVKSESANTLTKIVMNISPSKKLLRIESSDSDLLAELKEHSNKYNLSIKD